MKGQRHNSGEEWAESAIQQALITKRLKPTGFGTQQDGLSVSAKQMLCVVGIGLLSLFTLSKFRVHKTPA